LLVRAGFEVAAVEPSTGWFSTLAQTLRHFGASTLDPEHASLSARALAAAFRLLGRMIAAVAPALDRRLDRRRALPLGWIAVASRRAS
jgi:hypothetical protein